MPLAEGSHKAPVENQDNMLLTQIVDELVFLSLKSTSESVDTMPVFRLNVMVLAS
jgi:hypothetical protein